MPEIYFAKSARCAPLYYLAVQFLKKCHPEKHRDIDIAHGKNDAGTIHTLCAIQFSSTNFLSSSFVLLQNVAIVTCIASYLFVFVFCRSLVRFAFNREPY